VTSADRLFAALAAFVRHRKGGTQAKKHVTPLVQFAAAELVALGVPTHAIKRNVHVRGLYSSAVKLRAELPNTCCLLSLVTQSGSIRKNLTNRWRDILGDAVNLRYAEPTARLGLVYVMRADDEAMRRGTSAQSPLEELIDFMKHAQQAFATTGRPLIDACALIATDQERDGLIRIVEVGPSLDIREGFFERLIGRT
jgi:hypothetical protein